MSTTVDHLHLEGGATQDLVNNLSLHHPDQNNVYFVRPQDVLKPVMILTLAGISQNLTAWS